MTTEEIKNLENQNWICIECLERQCPRLVYPESPGHVLSNGPGSTLIGLGDKDGWKHGESCRRHAAGTSTCSIEDSNPDRFWTNLNYSSHQKRNKIYEEIVHRKPIFFNMFKNKTGELFLKCLETTLKPLAENSNHHEMSMKASVVLPHLTLARTTERRDGSVKKLLQKRPKLWINGDFDKLFEESHALQKRIRPKRKLPFDETKEFSRRMNSGKVANAIRTLENGQNGGVLDLQEKINGETVLQILKSKHPSSLPYDPALIVDDWPSSVPYHPSIFNRSDAHTIRTAILKTSGSHGPPGVDALEWSRYLAAFGSRSESLCRLTAKIAVRLGTEEQDPTSLQAYNACQLIPPDKCPGVRPMGVGEVLCRIIAKTLVSCIQTDLKQLGGTQQLCMGQRCGIEHAIHSLRAIFDENEAVLLIDARNALNLRNRKLALENIRICCPALFNAVKNSYSSPSPLYVNGTTLWSEEGTTQGDPLAMCMYGVAILPLIQKISKLNVIHKWYVEDGNACGRISGLYETFRALKGEGPEYGYFVNAQKC